MTAHWVMDWLLRFGVKHSHNLHQLSSLGKPLTILLSILVQMLSVHRLQEGWSLLTLQHITQLGLPTSRLLSFPARILLAISDRV